MVALTVKILFIAIAIIFIDLLTAPLLDGGLMLQGESYTILSLLLLIFDMIVAFMLLIAHFLTHISQVNVVTADFQSLIGGVMALLLFLFESLMEIVIWMVTLPFKLLSVLLSDKIGLATKVDFFNVIGVYVNFETMTFQLNVSPLPDQKDVFTYIGNIFNEDIPGLSGFQVQMKNVISFTFIPPPAVGVDIFGNAIAPYILHDNNFGFVILMLDRVTTTVFLFGTFEVGINTNTLRRQVDDSGIDYIELSLGGLLDMIIAGLSIDTLTDWIDSVYDTVMPSVVSEAIIMAKELEKVVYYG